MPPQGAVVPPLGALVPPGSSVPPGAKSDVVENAPEFLCSEPGRDGRRLVGDAPDEPCLSPREAIYEFVE